jgi:hypothetical protein
VAVEYHLMQTQQISSQLSLIQLQLCTFEYALMQGSAANTLARVSNFRSGTTTDT